MKANLKCWAAAGLMALFMGTAVAAPQLIIPKAAIVASAADTIKDYEVGDFIYTVNETKGTASLKCPKESKKGCLTSATVPATINYKTGKPEAKVTSISNCAFANEYDLSTVNLASASNLTTIEGSAFHFCTMLESVTIPANVTTIMANAFYQCQALSSVTFKTTKLTILNENTFCGCKSLTTISLPSSITEIGQSAFEGCSALMNITIPSAVKKIGIKAFSDCEALTKVKFASATAEITFDNGTFSGCTALNSVVCGSGTAFALPSGVTAIPSNMFSNCIALTSVNISAKIETIGFRAFWNCEKLTKINVDTSNTTYVSDSGVLYTKDHKTLIQYPSAKPANSFKAHKDTKEIAQYAFQNVTKLKTVDFSATTDLVINNFNFSDSTLNISNLIIPFSENIASNGANVLNKYKSIFSISKLSTLNGSALVNVSTDASVAPTFHSTIADAMYEKFTGYDKTSFMEKYLNAYAKYAVNDAYSKYGQKINPRADIAHLSQLEKAYAIYQWVHNKAAYDYEEYSEGTDKNGNPIIIIKSNSKNHCDASVFLHKKSDGKFYTVCDGYARAYNLVMKAAGIECYYISSGNYKKYNQSISHAFNCVKIGSNYYIADATSGAGYNFLISANKYKVNQGTFSAVTSWSFSQLSSRHITIPNKKPYELAKNTFADMNADEKLTGVDFAPLQMSLVKRITLTTRQRLLADVNCDGSVNYLDADLMRAYLNKIKGVSQFYRMCDVTMNGTLSNADATKLQKYLLGSADLTAEQAVLADVNNDGKLNGTDLSMLKSLLLYQLGDVNRDGKVDKTDKQMILNHIANITKLSNDAFWYADYNGDGSIDVSDAVAICVDYNITD